MKLVILEILIVVTATRAILALIGKSTSWTNPLWEFFALIAAAATAALVVQEVRKRLDRRPEPAQVVPPQIPLERIAPFTHEAMLVRYGARGTRDINLN